jgi:hypothetical protein
MKYLRRVTLSSTYAFYFMSVSVGAATIDVQEESDKSSRFTATKLSVRLNDDNLIFPICLLKARDDSWKLIIRNPPEQQGEPLVVSVEEYRQRTEGSSQRLTQKFIHEISVMCNLMSTNIWTLSAFQATLYWGEIVICSIPRNILVHFSQRLKMGFEIESSVFKIRPGKGDQTYMMDVFRSLQSPWAFTSDTLDESLQSASVAWMNTECKTINGLSYHQIETALNEVAMTWKSILCLCQDHTTDHQLKQTNIPFGVTWKNDDCKKADVWTPFESAAQKSRLAYPQITYSLPLDLLPAVFNRLVRLTPVLSYNDSSDLVRFATLWFPPLNERFAKMSNEDLAKEKDVHVVPQNASILEQLRIAQRLAPINTEINRRMQHNILSKFKESVATAPFSAAKGLAYLFYFYTYQLFSENMYIKEKEPGPKPMLAVMSRVPFSVMYRNLSEEEKVKFRNLVDTNLEPFAPNKLRKYKTTKTNDRNEYIELTDRERISLGDWYRSIVTPPVGREDLLSPPPGCDGCNPAYGMGAFNETSIPAGFALVEVRGYSRLKPKGSQITIDNVTAFIQNEARWFFTFQPSE